MQSELRIARGCSLIEIAEELVRLPVDVYVALVHMVTALAKG